MDLTSRKSRQLLILVLLIAGCSTMVENITKKRCTN